MRELLPGAIDGDVVIEVGRLLDDAEDLAPLPVHELVKRIRSTMQTRLSDKKIEELVVEMASKKWLASGLRKACCIVVYISRKYFAGKGRPRVTGENRRPRQHDRSTKLIVSLLVSPPPTLRGDVRHLEDPCFRTHIFCLLRPRSGGPERNADHLWRMS